MAAALECCRHTWVDVGCSCDMFSGVVGKKCVCFGKKHEKATMYGLKHRNALDEQVFFTPTKLLLTARAGKAMEATKAEGLLEMLQKCNANLEVVQKATRWKNAPKNLLFFL